MTDPYKVLGLDPNASIDDVKKEFKKLAMIHHPDKGGDENKFKEINNAYQQIINPDKSNQQFQHGFNGMDINDIFSEVFGHSPFGGPRHWNQQKRNRNIRVNIMVTLEEVHTGCEKSISIRVPNQQDKIVKCRIPAGIEHGQTISYPKMGDSSISDVEPGDLMVTIGILVHNRYGRIPNTDDLVMPYKLDAFSAMLGTKINVPTIDNKYLKVNIPSGVQHGNLIKIQNMGLMGTSGNRGNFFLEIKIEVPTNLTTEQRKSLDEIRNMR